MDIFYLKLLLSFITGAIVVTLATLISERVSSRLGGIITGMPSTSVIALVFIAWSQGDWAAIESTYAMPLGLAAATLFVAVYFLAMGRFGKALLPTLALSFFAWGILAIPAMISKQAILTSSLIYLPVLLVLYYIVDCSNKPNPQGNKPKAERNEIIARAFFGGFVISLSVITAKFAGPLFGGAFGTFPAVFSSTFIILHSKHGPDFMREFMRTIPLGSFSAFAFIISANTFCQVYGLIPGIVVAYGISLFALAVLWAIREKSLLIQNTKL